MDVIHVWRVSFVGENFRELLENSFSQRNFPSAMLDNLVPVSPPCWQPWSSKQVQPSIDVDHPNLVELNQRTGNTQTLLAVETIYTWEQLVWAAHGMSQDVPVSGTDSRLILWIKLLWIATETRNLWKFSPAKETRCTVHEHGSIVGNKCLPALKVP